MISVTLRFGLTKSITREVADGTTLADMLRDPVNKTALGFPESVSGVVDGMTVSQDEQLNDGDIVVLEKQAAAKA